MSKDLNYMGDGPINYHSSAYKRPGNNIYITRRIGEAVELEPHLRQPVESQGPPVVNPQFRPMTNQMLQQQQQQHMQQQQQLQQRQQPGFLQQLFGFGGGGGSSGNGGAGNAPSGPPPQAHLRPVVSLQQQQQHLQHGSPPNTFRAVSENDLYLLGAIEKLVYRVGKKAKAVTRGIYTFYDFRSLVTITFLLQTTWKVACDVQSN